MFQDVGCLLTDVETRCESHTCVQDGCRTLTGFFCLIQNQKKHLRCKAGVCHFKSRCFISRRLSQTVSLNVFVTVITCHHYSDPLLISGCHGNETDYAAKFINSEELVK